MKTVILKSHRDPNIGDLGLILQGMPANPYDEFEAALEGRVIAHDVLEHLRGPEHIGEVWDEYLALGAMWYIRGQWIGGPMYGPSDTLMTDVVRIAMLYASNGSEQPLYRNRPRGKLVNRIPYDGGMFGELEYIMQQDERGCFIHQFCEEAKHNYEFPDQATAKAYAKKKANQILAHLERGFCMAHARYGNPYTAYQQFKAIEEAANGFLKTRTLDEYPEGFEFKLTYGNGRAEIEVAYEDLYEDED